MLNPVVERDQVRDHCPLQQGLRPLYAQPRCRTGPSTRPLSTTTRIKTYHLRSDSVLEFGVRDHCPLQQGLRLRIHCLLRFFVPFVRDHCPLQQGLRLSIFNQFRRLIIVRDHCPLQQGLRP